MLLLKIRFQTIYTLCKGKQVSRYIPIKNNQYLSFFIKNHPNIKNKKEAIVT